MSLDLIHIPSIQLLDEIGRGADSIVYRGRHAEGVFAVKVLRDMASARAADTALRFRREAAVLARLRHPGIASVMEVGEAEGRTFLVMEYVEGPTLTQALDAGPLPEPEIAALGRGLADALGAIHRLGLVHRDVKPSNILFDGLNRPKLIDFGFAAQVNPHNPAQSIVGTFFYSAPEQTGMIKRPVDGRADLYALGVVLFECATGALPFESQDVGELIRQHAVAPPPDVRALNPAVSPALAAIIARLLAKDPDDRYQSGKGLAADLDRLENLNAALAEGGAPLLGARDEPVNSQFEAPLVGRSQEIGQLQELWNEARQGRGSMVLIEGETGIGKTRLVRELTHRAGGARALVLVGRCTDDPLPFEPLREAVDGYLRTVYALPETQKQKAADQVRAAAGDPRSGGRPGLLRRFSPLLAGLLGEGDETAADESPEHFYDAIVDFLIRLSRFHAGLVLFIDDIHGIEDASAQVLKRLNSQAGQAPLLAVCAGSSDAGQPLGDLAHEIGLPPSQRMVLLPLTIDAVSRLVAGRLGGFELDRSVIRQLATRSHGNPFAVEEYVKSMLDAGLLRPAWGSWQVDAEGLEELKLPGDVVQLVVRRIEDLAPETIEILRAAAVLGARFRLDLLPQVCGVNEEDVSMAVIEAAGEHLLERGAGGEYVFVHARVQEALLSQLDADAQRRIHRAIAGVLDRRGGDGEAHVYALARHYALGGISANPERTYHANVAAGRLALANFAHQEAYDFLSQALAAADLGAITPDAGVEATMGEVCVQTARMNEAVGHFKRSVAGAGESAQRAYLLGRLANAYLAQYRTVEAWEHLEKAFRELGATPPQTNARQLIGALAEWRRGRKFKRAGTRRPLTAREREQIKTKLSLYEIGGRTLFFNLRDELLLAQTIIRQLAAAQELGPSRELALAIGQYATLLNLFKRMKAADELIEEARAVAESQGDRQALAYVALNHALGKHLAGAALDAERLMRRGITEHGTWLDGGDYLRACLDLAWNLLMRGYAREAQEWLLLARARAEQTRAFGEEMSGHPLTFYSGSTLVVLGKPAEGLAMLEQGREYLESIPFEQYRWGWGNYLGHQMLAALELGDPAEALDELLVLHRRLNLRPGRVRLHLRHFYVFHAYARLALAAAAPPERRGPLLEPLRAAVAQLKQTATLPALRCHYLAAAGGLKRLEGQADEALKLLAAAAAEARDIDSPWALFEIARQRAAILAERGNSAGARREAYLAHDLAAEHGWPQRLRRIRAEFQIAESSSGKTSNRPTTTSRGTSTQHSSSMSSSGNTGSSSLKLQRYLDALLQVSLAAATVFDPELQARAALDEIVRILGAERAFLFTAREGSDQLDLKAGRDANRQDLAELTGYSRTVVERVRATRQPTVISGTDEGALLGSESVVTNNLRSIIAAPLLLRERLVGVVYLDNRLARGVFTEDDVSILLAVANHIAINFETARAVQKNQALLGAIPDLMFRIDRDGRFLEFIAAKGDDSGLPAHTYVGKTVEEVWPAGLAGQVRAQLAQTLSDGQPQVFEYQLQGRRKLRDFEARIVASGEHEVLALVRDITGRKENDRLKDEFITIVSHQLRTPLTSMTMSLEMLSRGIGGPLPDTSKMMIDVAYKNSSRLARLINMMLDIMRIKSGESEFELETLELGPLLAEALEKAAPLAEQFGVSFEAAAVPPGLPLRVDAERLVQALGHLLDNAARFSPRGAPVTVAVEPLDGKVRLAVRDEGPGIPEELRERIFQSFAQANVNIEDSQHQGSAGLGLSVTKAIIDRLNGQIWFETAAGAGTTFYVELPLAD